MPLLGYRNEIMRSDFEAAAGAQQIPRGCGSKYMEAGENWGSARYALAYRHGRRVNAGFYDGHVSSMGEEARKHKVDTLEQFQ